MDAKLIEFIKNSWSYRIYKSEDSEDNVYILEDETGAQYTAYLSDEAIELTAGANDIRLGKVALNDNGVVKGTKDIPAYYTTEGAKLVPNGSSLVIPFSGGCHEYTKFQAIICSFNTSLTNSVAAEKVVIDSNVYPVQSTTSEATIVVTNNPDTIDLGITNTFGKPCLLRYITYKEVY